MKQIQILQKNLDFKLEHHFNEKNYFIFFFFFIYKFIQKNIVYLDVQFIIDNSNLGKFYKNKIKKIKNKNKLI